jgi:hypothetical protein
MTNHGYKQGATLRAVRMAEQEGVTIQQLSRVTGKTCNALRSSAKRYNIKLKSEFKRLEWGSLKQKLVHMDTKKYTAKQVAEMLGTSIYTIYSLGARHDCVFKTAPYGSQKGTNYSIYGKTSKV